MDEFSNQLANVLTTTSDRKLPVDNGTYNPDGTLASSTLDGKLDFYKADIQTSTDYYSFGSPMTARTYPPAGAAGRYRYGFNGKENDRDLASTGEGALDFGARIYNPSLGRWFTPDNIQKAFLSSYQFGLNDPINIIDPDGNDEIHFIEHKTAYVDGFGRTCGPGTTEIKIIKKDGPDVFIHTEVTKVMTAKTVDAKGMQWYQTNTGLAYEFSANEVKVTFLHPNDPDKKSGITKSKSMMFDGLITWDEDDLDAVSVGKYMFQYKEFSDYMKAKNPKSRDWEIAAAGHVLCDIIFPTITRMLVFEMALVSSTPAKLGDLTAEEIALIQKEVDAAGRPLDIGGSAAKGTRRNIGKDLPFGKGDGTKSDIDYLASPSSMRYFEEGNLPGLDPKTGIIPGHGDQYIGPYIRFEPNAKPILVPGVEAQ